MSLHVFTEPHHFTACSHPIVHFTSCSLESSYVKFVMQKNTPSWRQRFRISRGSVDILQNGTKKCIECLDASHQYTLQSKQIQSLNVFGLHRRKMINEEICFARLWETPPGSSANSVWKVPKNSKDVTGRSERTQTTIQWHQLKELTSIDREDVDTCLNKWLLLVKSMNFDLRTVGHAPRRTRTGRLRTEAPGPRCFAHPAVHWPRAAAPPPLFYRGLLLRAAQCRLGPTPTHCEGRLGGADLFREVSSRPISTKSCKIHVKASYMFLLVYIYRLFKPLHG